MKPFFRVAESRNIYLSNETLILFFFKKRYIYLVIANGRLVSRRDLRTNPVPYSSHCIEERPNLVPETGIAPVNLFFGRHTTDCKNTFTNS